MKSKKDLVNIYNDTSDMNTNWVWVQYQCIDKKCLKCCDIKIRDKMLADSKPIVCPMGKGTIVWVKVWDSRKGIKEFSS